MAHCAVCFGGVKESRAKWRARAKCESIISKIQQDDGSAEDNWPLHLPGALS